MKKPFKFTPHKMGGAESCSLLKKVPARTHKGIYDIVSRIPKGRVATYGQVAMLAGIPGHARLVGYALSALRARTSIPWHRVVNAKGRISPRRRGGSAEDVQKRRLEREGVAFDASGRIPLDLYRWKKGK